MNLLPARTPKKSLAERSADSLNTFRKVAADLQVINSEAEDNIEANKAVIQNLSDENDDLSQLTHSNNNVVKNILALIGEQHLIN